MDRIDEDPAHVDGGSDGRNVPAMLETQGYAAYDSDSPLRPFSFQRRAPGEHDVLIRILYCGICHSDLHQVRNEWASSTYPMVPGHEIVGRVERVGAKVTKLAPGDIAGVGCLVDSCRTCASCQRGLEQYCEIGFVGTYNSVERDGKTPTYGGYSTQIVVDERFVLRVNAKGPLAGVAPLFCAGITTYSPLRHWKIGKGSRIAVLGLGGLGHVAVKLGVAMGAEVTLISSSPSKKADAHRLGAHEFLLGADDAAMSRSTCRFDFIMDTVSAPHDLARTANLLRTDGTMVLLGVPDTPATLPAFSLIMRRRSVVGSLIGGLPETQEMIDFCAANGITADVEIIRLQDVNEAHARLRRNDVRYRFVIDLASA
ncbi:Alcohol dehydrogenase [Minicystis rosea]|nr:Alcohol dehydrogenase [Minicystis rosea]